MGELLNLAIDAHGGWKRWKEVERLTAHAKISGAVWSLKGWTDALADVRISADAHRQHVEYAPFLKADQHSVYEPERTAIVAANGEIVEQRGAPRAA